MPLTVAASGGDAVPADQIVITVPGVDVEITIPVEDVPTDEGVMAPTEGFVMFRGVHGGGD